MFIIVLSINLEEPLNEVNKPNEPSALWFQLKSASNLNEIWCNLCNLPGVCVTLGSLCVPFRFPKWSLMLFYQVGLMKGSVLYPDPGDSWKSPFPQIAGLEWLKLMLSWGTHRKEQRRTHTHSVFDRPSFHTWRPGQILPKMGKALVYL